MASPTLSFAAASILVGVRNGYRYGFDIMDCTGLPSGTVYPALRRLAEARLVHLKWESETIAQKDQRPARKYFGITRAGEVALAGALKRYPLLERIAPDFGPSQGTSLRT